MNGSIERYVSLVEVLEVQGSFEEAFALIRSVAARLEREGVRGLASMSFYADRATNELGAILTFSDPSQMIDHVNMISGWDEFRRFAGLIKLKDMRIHGRLSPDVEAWIRQFDGPIRKFEEHVGGFAR